MSQRTVIRRAFAAQLTGLASTGAHVYLSRTRPLQAAELPAILVFSGESDPESTPIESQRPDLMRYRLRADILVKDATGGEDIADQIFEEISVALFASVAANTLFGKVIATRLLSIGEPDLDDSLEKPALRLPVLFETTFANP